MPPYDQYFQTEQLIITGHAIGVHTIHQEGQEYEVCLFPSPNAGSALMSQKHGSVSSSRHSWTKKNQKENNDNNKKKKKSWRVRFNKVNSICLVPHKSDMTAKEKASMWCNYSDWQTTEKERQEVARAIAFGYLTAQTPVGNLCLRGMESQIPHVARQRRETVLYARTLVLREQHRARLEGRAVNPYHMASCYGRAAEESGVQAYIRGLEDYHQVLQDDASRVSTFV